MTEEYIEGIPQYHDMKIWLLLAGGFQIFIGIFFLFAGIMSVFGVLLQSVTQSESTSLEMALAGMIFYLLLAACVIFLGIGTIMCRKWARALGAAGWGVALVWGIIGMIYFFLVMSEYPKMIPPQTGGGGGPPMQSIFAVVMVVMGAIISIFTIGIPALLFFFFKNKHVRMTCENLDRKARWTDAIPLPVLPMILILVSFLSSMSMMPFYSFTVPFFGKFLQGWEGAGVMVVCVVLVIFLIKALYKLRTYSWFMTLISGIIVSLSVLITFIKADFIELYRQMGYPKNQIEMMEKMNLLPGLLTGISLTFICFITYMFWIRKYFKGESTEELPKDAEFSSM